MEGEEKMFLSMQQALLALEDEKNEHKLEAGRNKTG